MNIDSIPEAPPLSTDEQFNKAAEAIRSFELQEMSYNLLACSICNERRINLTIKDGMCLRCYQDKVPVKMFSNDNNMNLGVVPPELADLSIIEQQLIARISPCISIHMLKHGSLAASGHCVSFPQEVNEPCKILPLLPSDVQIIKVRKQGKNDISKDFKVRHFKVQHSLEWLKKNNPVYADITISLERLSLLPTDGELPNIQTLEYDPKTKHSHDEGPAPQQIDPGQVQA